MYFHVHLQLKHVFSWFTYSRNTYSDGSHTAETIFSWATNSILSYFMVVLQQYHVFPLLIYSRIIYYIQSSEIQEKYFN